MLEWVDVVGKFLPWWSYYLEGGVCRFFPCGCGVMIMTFKGIDVNLVCNNSLTTHIFAYNYTNLFTLNMESIHSVYADPMFNVKEFVW